MKQKIVDKMKRVALTLFVALCAFSVWANVELEIQQPLVIKSDGTLDISYTIKYWDTGSLRNFDFTVVYNEEGSSQTTTQNILTKHAIQGTSTSTYANPVKYSGTYTLTGLDPAKVYLMDFKTWGMKTTETSPNWGGDNWDEVNDVYTVILSGISSASATWKILPTKEFVVSGVQDTQLNVTKAKIRYEIGENLTAFSANAKEEVVNFTDGKFEFVIPYENLTDDLLWSVWGQDANGNEYLYRDGNGVSLCLTERTEVSYSTYTWTGAADNGKWTDVSNWTANNPGWGFPGLNLGSATGVADFNAEHLAFRSTVCFEGSAEVDLEGNRYEFLEQDDNTSAANTAFRGFAFSKPADLDKMSVVLKNGTIGTKIPDAAYGPHLLGAAGVELEFRNAEFKIRTASNYLRPNAGATVVFSGDEGQTSGFKNQSWYFAPKSDKTNSRLVFRNFSGHTYYSEANTEIASGSVVELVNAQWKVRAGTANTAAVSKGFAERVILRDGADRQAMIKCMYYANNDDQYANVLLNNTYDIKIPAAGHTEASIWANNLTAASTCTFELDVTDYEASEKVPLVKLTSEPAFTLTANLVAKANGEDVTLARNAKLVWEGDTLYYQQGANEVVPGGDAVTVTAADETSALKMVDLKVMIPEGLTEEEVTAYKAAFTKDAKDNGNGTWEVTAILADSAKPLIGESAADAGDAFTVDAENVVITIPNYVKGLNYGVRSAAEIAKLETEEAVIEKATVTDGKITLEKSGDTKFYKVIVDFNEIKESPKAE